MQINESNILDSFPSNAENMLKDKYFKCSAQESHINNLPQKTEDESERTDYVTVDVNMLSKSCVIFFLHIKAAFGIIPESTFSIQPFTLPPAKSMPETASDFWVNGPRLTRRDLLPTYQKQHLKFISEREPPFRPALTPTPAKSMPETASDFGSRPCREGSLGEGGKPRGWGSTIKSRDLKGPKVHLSPQICSFITFWKRALA
ncbi:hypothetical protein CEXT_571871 [Caerostris extrusa]|uniref:Uncharacterized protein n=1 Tax=Caerostris extrusa TaxID=172846 RepID=A0AAV4TBW1_CAEEX|nr:hypothetical protein CEXT_571871 [Caerostris extrusa]